MVGIHPVVHFTFETLDIFDSNIVKEPFRQCVNNHDLFFNCQRLVQPLFQHFHRTFSAVQFRLGCFIQVGTELGECFQFTVGCQVKTQGTYNLLHRFNLRVSTYPGYGKTRVDCRTHTGEEQIRLQENLPVCNGNNVCRNVGRDVSCLSFNERQCG